MKRPPSGPMPLGPRLAASFLLIGEAAPIAPATFASFAILPLIFFFVEWPLAAQFTLTAIVTGWGIRVSSFAEAYYGHDGSPIVIDEVAGMLVTFLLVPKGGDDWWLVLLAGFFLFRLFDIVKPFPAGRAQNLPRGWGVVLDDVLAGVYANLALRLVQHVAGWGG